MFEKVGGKGVKALAQGSAKFDLGIYTLNQTKNL